MFCFPIALRLCRYDIGSRRRANDAVRRLSAALLAREGAVRCKPLISLSIHLSTTAVSPVTTPLTSAFAIAKYRVQTEYTEYTLSIH